MLGSALVRGYNRTITGSTDDRQYGQTAAGPWDAANESG